MLWVYLAVLLLCTFTACSKNENMTSVSSAEPRASAENPTSSETSDISEKEEEAVEALCSQALSHTYTLSRKVCGVTDAYAQPVFWTEAGRDEKVLMDAEEIKAYNAEITQKAELKVVDLTKEIGTVPSEKIIRLISKYEIGQFAYLDGAPICEEDKVFLEKRRNLDALEAVESVEVTYGLITNETDVRAYPSIATLMAQPDDWEFDYFQESTLKVGEGVRIYHNTIDGEWLFVQAKNYYGWVRSKDIACCSFDEMLAYLTDASFLMVTNPTDLETDEEMIHLSMGSRLLYEKKAGEPYAIRPVSKGGALAFAKIDLSEIEYHVGYLPYTTALVIDQAMKLLNTGYGWGGKGNLLDCSSTMLSVYECFGFSLPRNTSDLAKCTRGAVDVSMLGEDAKKEQLEGMRPGCMLLMKGHVMMYLGIKDDTVYALHAFTKYFDDEGNGERIMQCTITPLTIHKADGSTYLDAVHTLLYVQ